MTSTGVAQKEKKKRVDIAELRGDIWVSTSIIRSLDGFIFVGNSKLK